MSEGQGHKIEMSSTGKSMVAEASDGRLSLSVPLRIKRRCGRQKITLPEGIEEVLPEQNTTATPLQRALARGHLWQRMLESGECRSIKEIANKAGVDSSYVSRMLNLTTLAPEIVKAILDDSLPPTIILSDLVVDLPLLWVGQRGKYL